MLDAVVARSFRKRAPWCALPPPGVAFHPQVRPCAPRCALPPPGASFHFSHPSPPLIPSPSHPYPLLIPFLLSSHPSSRPSHPLIPPLLYTSLIVVGGSSQDVKLWSTATWQEATTLDLPARPAAPATAGGSGSSSSSTTPAGRFVLSVAWSVDDKWLACSSMDSTVAVFDTSTSPFWFLNFLEGHHMPVRSLAFSPIDPRILVTVSDDRHTHVYDVEGRQLIAALSGHTTWVLSADCCPDGATIATGSSDCTVRLWDMRQRAALQAAKEHKDQVWVVAFRPPGGEGVRTGLLASVSDDKSISLYDYS
ncbi:unnamed protein product [Closterium sp. NIES-54]